MSQTTLQLAADAGKNPVCREVDCVAYEAKLSVQLARPERQDSAARR